MDETRFLYYEEIDWQLRRDDLPLLVEPEARVRPPRRRLDRIRPTRRSGELRSPSIS